MNKNILYVLGIAAMFLVVACAQTEQPTAQPQPAQQITLPDDPSPAEADESSIDEVGTAIEDINTAEEDLDDSDLEDLDSILGDIENI